MANKELIFDLKSVRDRVSLIRLRYAPDLEQGDITYLQQVELKLTALAEKPQ